MRSKAVNGTGNKLQEKIYIEQKFTNFFIPGTPSNVYSGSSTRVDKAEHLFFY